MAGHRRSVGEVRAWRAAMAAALVAETVAGFLPWLRTGERERNAYELVDAARSLDALDSAAVRLLASAWYLVPLAAALCWLGLLLDPHRPSGSLTRGAAGLGLATGLLGVLFALAVEGAPIPVQGGVRATLVASLTVMIGSTGLAIGGVIEHRKAGEHELAPGCGRLAATGDGAH